MSLDHQNSPQRGVLGDAGQLVCSSAPASRHLPAPFSDSSHFIQTEPVLLWAPGWHTARR